MKLYCCKHRLDGMIIISKKCLFENCKKSPCFNYEDEKQGLYCGTHKLDNMVNIISPKCLYPNCKTLPSFNFIDGVGSKYCKKHKLDGMINMSKKCIIQNCYKQPSYNYENESKSLYCKDHKLENMIDIKHPKCLNKDCYTLGNKNYKKYCFHCFIEQFPDTNISKCYRIKEKNVVNFIKQHFSKWSCQFDKTIKNGCSNRRPDVLIDFKSFVMIIEIDENSHCCYDDNDEEIRMFEIQNDIDNRPLIIIRFNPDCYYKNDKKITSCWNSKLGDCIVKKSKEKEWNDRLNKLKDTIEYWSNVGTTNQLEFIKLFFDE